MFDAALLPEVLASAPDAIVVVDVEGRILYANRQLAPLFGYTTEEVLGQPVEMLLPARLGARHVGHRDRFHRSERARPMGAGQELFARRKDGSEVSVEISLSPIGEGERRFVAAAIRDATERRAAEAALREARAEADRANQAKSRFLATASHDLRQPLQALALLNGTLQRNVTDPEALDAIEQQGQAIQAVSRLLNALLDISKLESGAVTVEITDFDVRAALDELRSEFLPLAADKGLVIRLEGSRARARTDRTLLMQVLRNLLANAVKYTNQGSVRLRCRQDADAVVVDVIDTGIGIAPEHLAQVFDEFFQVGRTSHATREGYGLGLSIVQRIARLLRLEVAIESEPGRGSTFSLRLPPGTGASASTPAPAADRLKPAAERRSGSLILMVEDDAAVRRATQAFLRSEGHRVLAAASLAQALELAASEPSLDMIISDYHLGEARGTVVIEQVRRQLGRPCAAILMTGDTSSAVKDLPADEQLKVISKPVDAEELLDLIRRLTPAGAP